MQKYILTITALVFNVYLQAVEYNNILFDSRSIMGVYKQTSSETENNDIPALWDTFRKEIYDKLPGAKDNRVYVIYTDYAGDCRKNNPYTVIIGYESSFFKEQLENSTTVTIPAGVYKVAQRSGTFPDAVIGLWDDIFNSGYQQVHSINFEVYNGDLDAAPHVAVYLATQE